MSKLDQLRATHAAGDARKALGIAARFPALGDAREAITAGWAAATNPRTYREMGRDPDALFRAGVAAMEARYGLSPSRSASPKSSPASTVPHA